MTIVVRREPELVEREARRLYRGDDEKVATTTINPITVRGVEIDSRYSKAHELEHMRDAVLQMSVTSVASVARIWCDSKATNCYGVILREKIPRESMDVIADEFGSAITEICGGHNGFSVLVPRDEDDRQFGFGAVDRVDCAPDWRDW